MPDQSAAPPTPSPRQASKAAHVALLQQGMKLQSQRLFREAERCYQTVLRESPRNPDALNLLGTLAIEAKQPTEAIKLFEAALAELPNQPGYLNNLGTGLLVLRDYDRAQETFRQALEQDPEFIDALCNMGYVSKVLNDAEGARRFYERAVALAPGFPKARIGLGDLLVDDGEMQEAEAHFRRVLAVDPGNVGALTGLASAHKFVAGDLEPARMLELLEGELTDSRQRAALYHAAGKAQADLRNFDVAFKQFAAGKQLRASEFNLGAYRARHDTIIAAFDAEFFKERAAFGLDTEQPIFILGMPRSGTTLHEQIISSHSHVTGAGELTAIAQIANELGYSEADPTAYVKLLRRMTAAQSREIARIYLEQLRQHGGTSPLVTDKMPHNFEHLALIQLLFPRAHVVHCERDPIDTCVSCFTHNFNDAHGYNSDLNTLGLYYREYRRMMAHWRTVLPIRILDSSYEALISEQEPRSRVLIDFLGLEWEAGCLNFHTNDRLVKTMSRWQVRQPIYTSSMKSWQKYESHLKPLFDALGDLAER